MLTLVLFMSCNTQHQSTEGFRMTLL
uniref:Uncharacterized protein n=1 Tax=Anguilla anguilla TaxID=7936 RepID=A0A0E9VJF3_ANGAN